MVVSLCFLAITAIFYVVLPIFRAAFMKLFSCKHCDQLIYFENYTCEKCQYPLGFLAEKRQLYPLLALENGMYYLYKNESVLYRYCANHDHGVCNWLVPAEQENPFCEACSLNRTIPNLSKPEYTLRWKIIEIAKHRLVYTLLRMRLPLLSKTEDPERGLSFDFLADINTGNAPRILTGHAQGLITINIAEADDIEREMARRAMDEPYRTVLGHFRHEVGHYYWDRLIANSEYIDAFRHMFGDERTDYGEALKLHYEQGAPENWTQDYISAYASTHPWEDWAETWAHYLHIIDTLETAYAFGLSVHPVAAALAPSLEADLNVNPYYLEDFETLMSFWLPLTYAMNSLNRSMGHHDLYPFVIPPNVMEKLSFIHQVCFAARTR